jgi:hypothetical protein
MELREYIHLYWKRRWFLLLLVVIAVGTAGLIVGTRPVRTGASVSFAINRINRTATTQYEYDGYYALQASDLFAQTVVSWFSTPSFLQEVYEQGKLDPEIQSINSLPSRFSVRKYSAQNIVVRFTERTDDRAQVVAKELGTLMANRAEKLNQSSDGKALFAIISGTPVIAPAHPNLYLILGVTAVLSFALGLFIVAAQQYLR